MWQQTMALTSLYHNKINIFVQNHCACQVQLVGIGFDFELLSRILQVTNPVKWQECAGISCTSKLWQTNVQHDENICSLHTNTHLYTAIWTPSVMSSFNFLIFFSFLCPVVSLRAALASSWALPGGGQSWISGNLRVEKLLHLTSYHTVCWKGKLRAVPEKR